MRSTTTTRLTVRFGETDLMGIAHHATYLSYFEQGRVDWLKERGLSYDKWIQKGVHLPVVEARVRYRKPARFDDALVVETRVSKVTRVTVTFAYVVTLEGTDTVICEGETLLACVDEGLSPVRIPADVEGVLRGAVRAV